MPKAKTLRIIAAIGMIVALYMVFAYVKNVYRSYKIDRQIAGLKTEIEELKKENDGLDKALEYFKTPAFREVSAKEQLNLVRPGEEVISLSGDRKTLLKAKQFGDKSLGKEDFEKMDNIKRWQIYFFGL